MSESAGENPAPDWERIEGDYRAGVLSLREIASPYKVTEGAIRKRAKRDGWERDLRAKIMARADALVRKEEVRSAGTQREPDRTNDAEIVEINARRIADVQGGHKQAAKKVLSLGLALLEEVSSQSADIESLEKLGELMRAADEDGVDRLNDLYRKIISTPSRVDSAKKVAETLKHAIGMEREAYGLDNKAPEGEGGAVKGAVTYRANIPPRVA